MEKAVKPTNAVLLVLNCTVTLALAFGVGDAATLKPLEGVLRVSQVVGSQVERQLTERKKQQAEAK